MPEAIIDWSTDYFDKILLFVYANLEEPFQQGKGSRKKHCRPRKCYFQHGCLRPKDEATVFPPRQEKVLFKQPHFGGRFLTACQPFKEGIFSSLQKINGSDYFLASTQLNICKIYWILNLLMHEGRR